MKQPVVAGGVPLASIDEQNPVNQSQQEVFVPISIPHQPQLPLPDLLLEGRRGEYIEFGIPLYEASIKADWRAAQEILDKKPELIRSSITENGETALHVAASAKRTKRVVEFVQNLVDKMTKEDMELQNKSSNTALCLAAAAGNIEMVEIMVKKNRALLIIPGSQQMMPLYMAALFGDHDVVKYLYDESKKLSDDGWNAQNRAWLLQKCVEGNLFDIALRIVQDRSELASDGSVLGILAKKPDAFSGESSNFIKRTINWVLAYVGPKVGHPKKDTEALQLLRIIWKNIAKKSKKEIDDIIRGPVDPIKKDDRLPYGKDDQQLHLLKVIAEHVVKMPAEMQKITAGPSGKITRAPSMANTKKTYSSRMLFVAAEMGNTKFIVELIRLYPDLIWKVNDNNQSIFHIAVKHRNEGIYNLLYEIGSMKDLITPLRDENDNNMLHLVGKIAKRKRLQDVSGVALQMQRELLWFKVHLSLPASAFLHNISEVEAMIPPSYRERKNKDGLTPHELFTKEHKDLVAKGEQWMKGTASHCMVVAALIATIVFAAAFTVPGGYSQGGPNQTLGIPIFHSKATFLVFVLADAISLFSSAASILMFLSILTSRYAERDFLQSLPKKLMLEYNSELSKVYMTSLSYRSTHFSLRPLTSAVNMKSHPSKSRAELQFVKEVSLLFPQ
ncbi:ankyrin repeat-containing domain, PGG domain protein [Tanacetum coccineum]